MGHTRKIAIGCIVLGVISVAVIVCIILGIFFLGTSSEYQKVQNEGADYGGTTDQLGCQTEALHRLRLANKSNNVIKHSGSYVFLNGCFQTCNSSVGYCSGAPTEDGFLKVRAWAQQRCHNEQLDDDSACVSLFMEVADVCLGKTKRRK